MDCKSQYGFEQIQISKKLDEVVQNTIKKAEKDKKSKVLKSKIFKLGIAAASILVIFISSINLVPAFAQSISKVPLIGNIARYFIFYHDDGIKTAIDNNFIQETNLSASDNGIRITIDNIIADNRKLTIMYSLAAEKGYDNLQQLLPKNFRITDKMGRLILSTEGSNLGVKEFRSEATGELLDYINILAAYGPRAISKESNGELIYDKNSDVPDKEYLNKFSAIVFQYHSKNKDFTENKKATGTIEITALDGNLNIPNELSIEFTKLTEAYYQPEVELISQRETKQFTQEAFVEKNNREALNIDGKWSLGLNIDKTMKTTKPKVVENIKFIAGGIDFNIEKIEAFPTKTNLSMIVGKSNGKNIEFYGLYNAYLVDDTGKKYKELVGEEYIQSTHRLTASFESYHFDDVKELYLVIGGFDYCYEGDRDNMKNVKDVKVRIK